MIDFQFLWWRIDNGWYYRWDLGYNSSIDWTGHPGAKTQQQIVAAGEVALARYMGRSHE